MLGSILAAALLAAGAAAPAAAPPTVDAMFKRAQYEQVQISPDGQLLAIAYHVDDGTMVTIVRRANRPCRSPSRRCRLTMPAI